MSGFRKEQAWYKHYDPGVPHTLTYPDIPVGALLESGASKYAERACTIYLGKQINFHDMNALSTRFASGLGSLGVKKNQQVGLLIPNSPHFVMAFFGILIVGGVVVAINPSYTPTEIMYQANDAGIKVLVTTSSLYSKVNEFRSSTTIQHVIIVDLAVELITQQTKKPTSQPMQENIQLQPGDKWLTDLPDPPSDWVQTSVLPDDPAILQYSGGTTGTPKGATGTHRNLVANALQTRAWLSNCVDGEEIVLMAIPLFHVYGMVFGMIYAMASGSGLLIVPNSRDLTSLLKNIQYFRPTIFPGVPAIYTGIVNHPDVVAGKYDLRSIKACISGSAPLSRETKDKFEALTGGKLCEGYGLSEAPTATHCNPILGENRTGSIGLPYPDVDAQIVDLETGLQTLAPGEIGELILRGPQVMKGYHNLPDETGIALRDLPDGSGRWLYTGDIARMDADGYFFILDRKKELIKPGGLQVWPNEVEAVLQAHPGILEAGVTGIPDVHQGEVVKAWVVLRPNINLKAVDIVAWCRERLAPYKIPAEIEFIHQLPRTSIGKLLRRELRKQGH